MFFKPFRQGRRFSCKEASGDRYPEEARMPFVWDNDSFVRNRGGTVTLVRLQVVSNALVARSEEHSVGNGEEASSNLAFGSKEVY